MYRDLTENKPPLGYWLYALAVAIGGYNELSIRLLPIPAVLLSIALVWWIGWRLGGSLAACLAAGLFVVLSTDPYLFGNGSNMEHFMNLFSVASLALLILAWSRLRRWPIVAAGVCLGAATLVKQVAILPALVYFAALALRRRGDTSDHERPAWRERVGDIIALGLGLMLAVGLAAGILLAQVLEPRPTKTSCSMVGAGDRHPARARGTFGPGSVADRQCGSVGSAPLAVRLDNVSRLVGDGKLAALVGRGPRDGLPAGRTQLVREPPPGCRLDPRGELAGRPSRPLLAALLSLADPGHRPGRGHGTGRLPGRLDRSFEAEGRRVATKSAEGRRIIGRGLDSDNGHRSDPGDPGSKLPLGSSARADGSLQGRRPVGRAPGPGPRARQTLERLA